jgi:hypothetical protein
MSDHFFSRWSRRKQGLEQDGASKPAEDASRVARVQSDRQAVAAPSSTDLSLSQVPAKPLPSDAATSSAPEASASIPTLEDAQNLTPASDFQSFMREGVPGEVRNAAMKKLFTDPHFNVMDGLDIYIGDYNTPDPLPPGMLEKMVGAELLNLFPAKTTNAPSQMAEPHALENPEQSPVAPEGSPLVAQSPQSQTTHVLQATLDPQATDPLEHDHPDLQLQPNHATASPDPGQSAG